MEAGVEVRLLSIESSHPNSEFQISANRSIAHERRSMERRDRGGGEVCSLSNKFSHLKCLSDLDRSID